MTLPLAPPEAATLLIIFSTLFGAMFALSRWLSILSIPLTPPSSKRDSISPEVTHDVSRMTRAIADGAHAFLVKQYTYLSLFVVLFSLVLLVTIGATTKDWTRGVLTAVAYVFGAFTSGLAGWLSMKIAVASNARTALRALGGLRAAFRTAFDAGSVMGFNLVCMCVLGLATLNVVYRALWLPTASSSAARSELLYHAISGFGLGGSSVALFGRVGGGIFTKAADVGADLSGKIDNSIPEDDPRNCAVIADQVGDNVGDVAGMNADLFGSLATATCAAQLIGAESMFDSITALSYPLAVSAVGIMVSLLATMYVTHLRPPRRASDVQPALRNLLLVATVLLLPLLLALTLLFLPAELTVSGVKTTNVLVFVCVSVGLVSGLVVAVSSDYYTSNSHEPVRELAESCRTGAATNIIYGLALGYESTIVPAFAIAFALFTSQSLAGQYGMAISALGILSTLCITLAIDGYGPVCDNAGGIAEMAHMPEHVREITDALDAAGNTTAAVGKSFAIASAAAVAAALYGAFVAVVKLDRVDIVHPLQFAGLLIGAMMPYWFSALTMKSVGTAALDVVAEARRQFKDPRIRSGEKEPDYVKCVDICTTSSLVAMFPPGMLVVASPLICGFLFGVEALAGFLLGVLVSATHLSNSAANSGGAWDNAKKFVEAGGLGIMVAGTERDDSHVGDARGSEFYEELERRKAIEKEEYKNARDAAVTGDTVGDPLKDTSGPALNILIKLSFIIAVVFAPAMPSIADEGYLVRLWGWKS